MQVFFWPMANKSPRSMAINFKRLAIDHDIQDNRSFEYRLAELIDEYASLELEEINMSALNPGTSKDYLRLQIKSTR